MRRSANWKSATTPLPKLKVIDRSPIVTLRNTIIENPVLDHLSFETLLELRESLREHSDTLRNFKLFQRANRVSAIEKKVDKRIQEECDLFRDYGSSPARRSRRHPKEALVRRQQQQILANFEGVWATEMYETIHRGEDPAAEEAEYEQRYSEAREKLMQKFAAELSQFDNPEQPFVVVSVKKQQRRPVVASSIVRLGRGSPAKRERIVQPVVERTALRANSQKLSSTELDEEEEKNVPLVEDRLKFASMEVFVPASPRNVFDDEPIPEEDEHAEIREVATEPHLPLAEDHLKYVSTEVFVPGSPRGDLEDDDHVGLSEDRMKFVSTEVFVPSSPRNIFDEPEHAEAIPEE